MKGARTPRTLVTSVALFLACSAAARPASAFSIDTSVSYGCHERITTVALRFARERSPTFAPMTTSNDERALVRDAAFTIDSDLQDLGAVALLLGVRDNDLKGNGETDLAELTEVHGDPERQHEHCLRSTGQDGPEGNAAAIEQCRTFIRDKAAIAIDALLSSGGSLDQLPRTPLEIHLAIRGRVTAQLPEFHVATGQALHAIQDSFTHSFRTKDARRVTVVLNWVDVARDELVESRDGPPHMDALDRCDGPDDLRRTRVSLAAEASAALLLAIASDGDRATRLRAVETVLDTYLAFEPGCTLDNHWCDAAENGYRDDTSACAFGRGGAVSGGPLAAVFLAIGVGFVRRRRRGRALAMACALIAMPGVARAEESPPEPPRSRWGIYGSAGAALDNPALAFSLGGRYRIDDHWLTGLDVEWNPFASLHPMELRSGALNVYGTIIRRWPMLAERFDLRTTGHIGTSTLLFDLYGVPSGSTGPYFGVNLLGIEWRATRTISVVIDPADVALPIPKMSGLPYAYLQYRFMAGIQWGG